MGLEEVVFVIILSLQGSLQRGVQCTSSSSTSFGVGIVFVMVLALVVAVALHYTHNKHSLAAPGLLSHLGVPPLHPLHLELGVPAAVYGYAPMANTLKSRCGC